MKYIYLSMKIILLLVLAMVGALLCRVKTLWLFENLAVFVGSVLLGIDIGVLLWLLALRLGLSGTKLLGMLIGALVGLLLAPLS